MSHTQGPWALNRYGEVICSTGEIVQVEGFALSGISRPETRANRDIMAAAPELFKELSFVVDTEEQSCFEQWLSRATPSGDCDSVQSQWLESSDFEDFCDLYSGPISAIAKAKGATK
jgi:hypothetical protein